MEKPHFASIALSVKNCSQIAVPTPKSEEEEEKYWRKGRTKKQWTGLFFPFSTVCLSQSSPHVGFADNCSLPQS